MNSLWTLRGAPKTLILLAGLSVLFIVASCTHSSSGTAEDYDAVTKQFGSLVSAGRFESADSLVRAERAEGLAAGDSERWCSSKVHEAVLN